MGDAEKGGTVGRWRGRERTLIRAFFAMFATFALMMFIMDVLIWEMEMSFWRFLLGISRDLIVGYAITSFILGIYFTWVFKGTGIVPFQRLLRKVVHVAVVVAIVFTILYCLDVSVPSEVGVLDVADFTDPGKSFAGKAVAAAMFFLLTLLASLLVQLGVLVGGFGIMGMIFVFEVGGTPRLLESLEGITRNEDRWSRVIMWFFGIPGALDTDVLLVDGPKHETTFPWRRFRTAVLWQVAFGVIIAIYVSLNPWLLRSYTMNELFQFMSTAFVVLPFLVIPWFIHRRLNARFKGVSMDFHIFKAFRDRFTGLIIAGGTLLIFLRFAWERSSVEEILIAFSSYVFIMVLCIVAFTFIYFNFFENELAKEAFDRWKEARERALEGSDGGEGSHGGEDVPSSEEGS